ncbi:MerR family transcriptional regulator [Streptomyces badius]
MAEGREHREYRMEELAKDGITVRTLRFYRERGLIPPPRREGRIAWYDDHHLARLRTIAGLLERGHTLNGIADLAATFESGRDVAEVLGLGEPTEETPVRLTPEQLADYFEGEVTPENLAAALDLGYLATDGDEIVHKQPPPPRGDVRRCSYGNGCRLPRDPSGRRVRRERAGATRGNRRTRPDVPAREETEPGHSGRLARAVVVAELSMALDRRLRREDGKRPEGVTARGCRGRPGAAGAACGPGRRCRS